MSKLHFYDTGLAAWILGIRKPRDLDAHPLRGPLMETWVVSEIVKHRANAGEAGRLYHYRDRGAVEADLILDGGRDLTIVEVKSTRTATRGLFDGVQRIHRLLGDPDRPSRSLIVYGGDARQQRRGIELVPWSELGTLSWS